MWSVTFIGAHGKLRKWSVKTKGIEKVTLLKKLKLQNRQT